jgi:hypothetical protein
VIAVAHAVQIGAGIAALCVVLSAYELTAILNGRLPTISRVLQGWRDSGTKHREFIALVGFVGIALAVFAIWLMGHLGWEQRSDL